MIGILLTLKLKPKDEVIIPACTFVACANVVEIIGAKIIFADIDPKTKLMDLKDCLNKVTKNTKVIMPVHLYGNLFDTYKLKKKIRKNILIIEDSAHAFQILLFFHFMQQKVLLVAKAEQLLRIIRITQKK